MTSKLNNSRKPNPQLQEKLKDIKCLQSNWMKERKQQKDMKVSKKEEEYQCRELKKKKSDQIKKTEPETISWIVNSNTNGKRKTTTSFRSRSASPSNTRHRETKKEHTKIISSVKARPSSASSHNSLPSGYKSSESSKPKCREPRQSCKPNSNTRPPSGKSTESIQAYQPNARPPSGKSTESIQAYQPNTRLRSGNSTEFNQDFKPKHPSGISSVSSHDSVNKKPANNLTDLVNHQSRSNPWSNLQEKRQEVDCDDSESMKQLNQNTMERTIDAGILNRLADQVAHRVKSELRLENFKKTNESLPNTVNGDKIESHHCIQCRQLMVAPDHIPTILIPCGHTFCEACSEDRIKCPTCRTKVTSITVNSVLEQIICQLNSSMVKQHQNMYRYNPTKYENDSSITYESNWKDSGRHHIMDIMQRTGEDCNDMVQEKQKYYQDQFDDLDLRCDALKTEEVEIEQVIEELLEDYDEQKKVLGNIDVEENRIKEEISKLEDKLQVLKKHKEEYESRCSDIEKQKTQEAGRLKIIKETLRNHAQNKEKVKMLARNFNISIE